MCIEMDFCQIRLSSREENAAVKIIIITFAKKKTIMNPDISKTAI